MLARHENRPLTALRGLAACWVVAHHAPAALLPDLTSRVASALRLGHVAVDIFFVLSGYILARIYRDLTLAEAPEFWLRRICRIYPLHLTVMAGLAVLAAGTTMLHINRTDHDWAAFPVVLALIQPYVPGAAAWNEPSWSAGIELACYAIFPWMAGPLRHAPKVCLIALALLMATAEVVVLRHGDGAVEGWMALLRGLAGFHLGAVLAGLSQAGLSQAGLSQAGLPGARFAPAGAWLSVSGLLAGVLMDDPVVVVLASGVLIAALGSERGVVARVLSAEWLVWLGRVSFSIYLLHAPLLVLAGRLPMGALPRLTLMTVILLAASTLTYRFIEEPGRRLPALLRRRPRPLAGRVGV